MVFDEWIARGYLNRLRVVGAKFDAKMCKNTNDMWKHIECEELVMILGEQKQYLFKYLSSYVDKIIKLHRYPQSGNESSGIR